MLQSNIEISVETLVLRKHWMKAFLRQHFYFYAAVYSCEYLVKTQVNENTSAQFSNSGNRGNKSTSERFLSCWVSYQTIIYFNKAFRCSSRDLLGIWSCFCINFAKSLKIRLANFAFLCFKMNGNEIFWLDYVQNNYF